MPIFRITTADHEVEMLEAGLLEPAWREDVGYTRAIGDHWLAQRRSLALLVPSAVLPAGASVLLNPLHPSVGALRVAQQEPLRFDPRLRPPST